MELVMDTQDGKSIAELCEEYGRKLNTINRKWTRKIGGPFSLHHIPTSEQIAVLFGKSKVRKTTATQPRTLTTPAAERLKPLPVKTDTRRDWLLYGILAAPTIASIQNMYIISSQILEDGIGAVLLTVVLSATAFAFILAGVRQWYTYILALILVLFESFCNMTRIYGGLTHWEKAEPTRFLGIVTDIFNSGTYSTAIVLGTITAFCIAAVQYAAIFELNKSK